MFKVPNKSGADVVDLFKPVNKLPTAVDCLLGLPKRLAFVSAGLETFANRLVEGGGCAFGSSAVLNVAGALLFEIVELFVLCAWVNPPNKVPVFCTNF